ncbi:Protein BZZ1 [Leucoagaricus sp. SymC.cos]|nr:Protein BZZ1 [Leucoagaricus sp. SymC.cos]
MATKYTIAGPAYIKLFFHLSKHSHQRVNGVLIGKETLDGGVEATDAVPLLHHWTSLSPMTEIGLDLAGQYADSLGLQVVGYYQACERVEDTALFPVGERIVTRIKQGFNKAVAFVLDASQISEDSAALVPYIAATSSNPTWRPAPTSPKPFSPESSYQLSPSTLPATAVALVREQKLHMKFGDFDDHLEDVAIGRVALEREYAAKLQTLTRKAIDKKAKMEARYIVGEDPTKSWDNSTLKRSTLDNAYDALINSITDASQDHLSIAEVLASQVIEVMRVFERKSDDAKKKELQFFHKLLQDRDGKYAERLKSKQKYDAACEEVEALRQKQTRTQDEKHKGRAAKQADQQQNDMLNSKNTYLISTAIANQIKDKFYGTDMPSVENEFQRLQTQLVERLVKILLHGQSLQLGHLENLKKRINNAEIKLNQVQPLQDQALFINHNVRPFSAPGDWKFEPCTLHYDTDNMSVEPAPKILLQNKLSRSVSKSQELEPLISSKQSEFDRLSRSLQTLTIDHSFGKIDELVDSYLETRHQLTFYHNSRCILNAEIETIESAIGDDIGVRAPHDFKSSSFSIPTQCGYCESTIWGLSKQGKTCKSCGLSVHNKCELKVPADCPQGSASVSSLSRRTTASSRLGGSAATSTTITPSPSSFVQSQAPEEEDESYPTATVLFDFIPSSDFELGVHEGTIVEVLEPDDGSGWVKVMDPRGKCGLVPASYIGPDDNSPNEGGSTSQETGERVQAMYPYESQGPDELGLHEGEILKLSPGGKDYGNGWWEGFNSKGQKGIFPSNYVRALLTVVLL